MIDLFVLVDEVFYEGEAIVGVFTSAELANDAAKSLKSDFFGRAFVYKVKLDEVGADFWCRERTDLGLFSE